MLYFQVVAIKGVSGIPLSILFSGRPQSSTRTWALALSSNIRPMTIIFTWRLTYFRFSSLSNSFTRMTFSRVVVISLTWRTSSLTIFPFNAQRFLLFNCDSSFTFRRVSSQRRWFLCLRADSLTRRINLVFCQVLNNKGPCFAICLNYHNMVANHCFVRVLSPFLFRTTRFSVFVTRRVQIKNRSTFCKVGNMTRSAVPVFIIRKSSFGPTAMLLNSVENSFGVFFNETICVSIFVFRTSASVRGNEVMSYLFRLISSCKTVCSSQGWYYSFRVFAIGGGYAGMQWVFRLGRRECFKYVSCQWSAYQGSRGLLTMSFKGIKFKATQLQCCV